MTFQSFIISAPRETEYREVLHKLLPRSATLRAVCDTDARQTGSHKFPLYIEFKLQQAREIMERI